MKISSASLKSQFDKLPKFTTSNNLEIVRGIKFNWLYSCFSSKKGDEKYYYIAIGEWVNGITITYQTSNNNVLKIGSLSFKVSTIEECEELVERISNGMNLEIAPIHTYHENN